MKIKLKADEELFLRLNPLLMGKDSTNWWWWWVVVMYEMIIFIITVIKIIMYWLYIMEWK